MLQKKSSLASLNLYFYWEINYQHFLSPTLNFIIFPFGMFFFLFSLSFFFFFKKGFLLYRVHGNIFKTEYAGNSGSSPVLDK